MPIDLIVGILSSKDPNVTRWYRGTMNSLVTYEQPSSRDKVLPMHLFSEGKVTRLLSRRITELKRRK